ncbi:MAG: hypothetical protein ACFE0O_06190 [Opitutales bacterium]
MAKVTENQPGLFLQGTVVSNSARRLVKKDGSGAFVIVTHEITLAPGIVTWERYLDVSDPELSLEGETVTRFPTLPDLKPVTLKVSPRNIRVREGQLTIKDAETLV